VDLEPVQGLQELLMAFLERLYSTKQSGRNVSKGVLTAMSVKIPITKLLKMAILHLKLLLLLELWLLLCGATKYASYILGDYEVKVLRKT
jgi:hypothetical protein